MDVNQMIQDNSLFMIIETDHLAVYKNICDKDKYIPITKVLKVGDNIDDVIVAFLDVLSSYPKNKYDIKYVGTEGVRVANIYDITKHAGWIQPFSLNVLTKTISICECEL